MRILFTGGGSGGHIFPIIAIKREIDLIANNDVLFQFVGGETFVKEALSEEGIPQKKIITTKWRRYFSFKNFLDILKFPFSLLQAAFYIWLFMPDVIFSKGGPGSFAVVLVGWFYQIPIIIHESDSIPGFTNKLTARFAKKIAISFQETIGYFPKEKTILTGHPIRQKLIGASFQKAKRTFNLNGSRKVILIMGGSQGANQINYIFIDAIYRYIEKYEIIHICGKKNFREIQLLTKGLLNENQRKFYHLYPSLSEIEMGEAYAAADLIISRAGAGTLFEIAAFGKPSIIIPLPGGAQNHQAKNAFYFAKAGAIIAIEESNVKPNFVFSRVSQVIENSKLITQMKEACKSFATLDAAVKLANLILDEA